MTNQIFNTTKWADEVGKYIRGMLLTLFVAVASATLTGWWVPVKAVLDEPARAEARYEEITDRLTFIEKNMPPPDVVSWAEGRSHQVGSCGPKVCLYSLVANRTPYGEGCGAPTEVSVFIRAVTGDGPEIQTAYDSSFIPITLDRELRRFEVPILKPTGVQHGVYEWQSRTKYATCSGSEEPIVRPSPWFPLLIN